MSLFTRVRGKLCGILGHKYIGDPYRKLCVYCWKEVVIPYVPGEANHPPDPPPDR